MDPDCRAAHRNKVYFPQRVFEPGCAMDDHQRQASRTLGDGHFSSKEVRDKGFSEFNVAARSSEGRKRFRTARESHRTNVCVITTAPHRLR